MSLLNYPLLTISDAIDYVLDQVVGGDQSPRNKRMAWYAVRDAYEEVPHRRNWRYYYRSLTIHSVASQTTGSIAYDYTGGTYERMVTLTSTTWPSDVTKYAIYLSGNRYTIETRKSSTVITLAEKDAPTADIDSGTAYKLVRDVYELPDNLRKLLTVYDTTAPGRLLECVDPGDIIQEQRISRTSSTPLMYSVYRSELYASSMALHFAPSPNTAVVYQAYGIFHPQPLKVLDYSLGTVATTSGSSSLTGTGTTFTSDHEGAVIRFSKTADTSLPTDIQGEIDKNRVNPYAMQRVIRTKDSATTLTLEQDADTTLSGSGYRISSRIDIEPGAMRNAFLRCCEARFAVQDRPASQEREARYERALAIAMYADQRLEETLGPRRPITSLGSVVSTSDLTTGGTQP